MNVKKVELIIKNMELLIQSLKMELQEDHNVVKLEDMFKSSIKNEYVDDYEPNYYEEP